MSGHDVSGDDLEDHDGSDYGEATSPVGSESGRSTPKLPSPHQQAPAMAAHLGTSPQTASISLVQTTSGGRRFIIKSSALANKNTNSGNVSDASAASSRAAVPFKPQSRAASTASAVAARRQLPSRASQKRKHAEASSSSDQSSDDELALRQPSRSQTGALAAQRIHAVASSSRAASTSRSASPDIDADVEATSQAGSETSRVSRGTATRRRGGAGSVSHQQSSNLLQAALAPPRANPRDKNGKFAKSASSLHASTSAAALGTRATRRRAAPASNIETSSEASGSTASPPPVDMSRRGSVDTATGRLSRTPAISIKSETSRSGSVSRKRRIAHDNDDDDNDVADDRTDGGTTTANERDRDSTPEIPLMSRGPGHRLVKPKLELPDDGLLHPGRYARRQPTPADSAVDGDEPMSDNIDPQTTREESDNEDALSIGRAASEAPSIAGSTTSTQLPTPSKELVVELMAKIAPEAAAEAVLEGVPAKKRRGRPPKKKPNFIPDAKVPPARTASRMNTPAPSEVEKPAVKRTPSEIADVTVLATKIQRTLDFERELIHQDEHPMLLESLADFTLARKLRMAELDLLQRSRQEARMKMIEYESRQNWLQWEDRKRALWTDMWRDLRSRERRLIAEVCDSDISALLCPMSQSEVPPAAYPLARILKPITQRRTRNTQHKMETISVIPFDVATSKHDRWALQTDEIASDLHLIGLRELPPAAPPVAIVPPPQPVFAQPPINSPATHRPAQSGYEGFPAARQQPPAAPPAHSVPAQAASGPPGVIELKELAPLRPSARKPSGPSRKPEAMDPIDLHTLRMQPSVAVRTTNPNFRRPGHDGHPPPGWPGYADGAPAPLPRPADHAHPAEVAHYREQQARTAAKQASMGQPPSNNETRRLTHTGRKPSLDQMLADEMLQRRPAYPAPSGAAAYPDDGRGHPQHSQHPSQVQPPAGQHHGPPRSSYYYDEYGRPIYPAYPHYPTPHPQGYGGPHPSAAMHGYPQPPQGYPMPYPEHYPYPGQPLHPSAYGRGGYPAPYPESGGPPQQQHRGHPSGPTPDHPTYRGQSSVKKRSGTQLSTAISPPPMAIPNEAPRKVEAERPRQPTADASRSIQPQRPSGGPAADPSRLTPSRLQGSRMHLDESEPDWRARTSQWQRDLAAVREQEHV